MKWLFAFFHALMDRRTGFVVVLTIAAVAVLIDFNAGCHLIGAIARSSTHASAVWLVWAGGHVPGRLFVDAPRAFVYWIALAAAVVGTPMTAILVRRIAAVHTQDNHGDLTVPDRIISLAAQIGLLLLVLAFLLGMVLEATGSAAATAALSYKMTDRVFVEPFFTTQAAFNAFRTLYVAGGALLICAGLASAVMRQFARAGRL